jgi:hypothetical protein
MARCPLSKALLASVIVLLSGCAAPAYKPAVYSVASNRPYSIPAHRMILVVPCFDLLDEANRSHVDPSFNPSAYVTGMVESELSAGGASHERPAFPFTPTFEGVQTALRGGAFKHPGGVVLASAVNHYMSDRVVSCDFILYAATGDLIFEKRCLCMNFGSSGAPEILAQEQGEFIAPAAARSPSGGTLVAAHMVMQQLFADPDLQRVLQ